MCFTQKIVFTICAHSTVELVECKKFHNNPNKSGRHACIVPLCQHSQALATVLGFCKACKAAYMGVDFSNLNATKVLWNFWCFKAVQEWNHAVDPSRVPATALTSATKRMCKSWFGYVRAYKEVSMDMITALSTKSLLDTLGEPIKETLCDLCRTDHRKDVDRIAIGMREATISWARGLKRPEEIFKSYEIHHGSSQLSAGEEANLAAYENQSLETTVQSQPPAQQSAASPLSSEDFPMRAPPRKARRFTKRLNSKVRMEIAIHEREEMLRMLEVEHNRRVRELQAQVDLDDAGVSTDTSRSDAYDSPVCHPNPPYFAHPDPVSHVDARETTSRSASARSSLSGADFEGFSGAWDDVQTYHAQANKDAIFCESPRRDNNLHCQGYSYANLVGGADEFLLEKRQAQWPQYRDIVEPEEMFSEKQDSNRQDSGGYLASNRFSFTSSLPNHSVGGVRRVRRIEDELAEGYYPEYPQDKFLGGKYPNEQCPENEYLEDNDHGEGVEKKHCEQNANEEGQGDDEDTIDAHINFYLDDNSISVSERVRPLTYISPVTSIQGSDSSSAQNLSPPGSASVDALPSIPPASPLHFTEFSFLADLVERSDTTSDIFSSKARTYHSELSAEAADSALKGGLGGDTFGPASRVSSGIAPLMGPEIRSTAPPRPPRGPWYCTTHGTERQIGCHGCQLGELEEVGMKPGERMTLPEPEEF